MQVVRSRQSANNLTNGASYTYTTTQYDQLGRVTDVTYSDGTPEKQFSYDNASGWNGAPNGYSKGRLTMASTVSPWSATQFQSYDAMGRPQTLVQCLPGWCGNTSRDAIRGYGYDLAGNKTYEGYTVNASQAFSTGYAYSPAGEMTYMSGDQNDSSVHNQIVNVLSESVFGPSLIQYGNGLLANLHYDGLGRHNGGWLCRGSQIPECPGGTYIYGYNATSIGSRVVQSADAVLGRDSQFQYDSLGRLKSISPTGGGTSFSASFSYDRYGNRWNQTINGVQKTASYDAGSNKNWNQFTYDTAGNVARENVTGYGYRYDADGNLTAVLDGNNNVQVSYFYDVFNHRVQASRSDGTIQRYSYDIDGNRALTWNGEETTASQTQFYANGRPVAYYQNGPNYSPVAPSGYIRCSGDGQACNVPGIAQVAYGAKGQFSYRPVVNSVVCGTAAFGDPAYGVPKDCFYSVSNGTPLAGPSGTVFCAYQGHTCITSGAATVYYGYQGSFIPINVNSPISCDDNTFGDPTPGLIKACYIQQASSQPAGPYGYILCAAEYATCNLPGGPVQVAYGVNGQWHFIPMTASSVACTDQTFGDPVPGILKNCFYSISNGGDRVGPTNYVLCANEGEHCSFQGAATIAYGTNGTFAYHPVSDGFDCNNALGDPTPGLIKSCSYLETFAGGSHIYYQHQDYLGTNGTAPTPTAVRRASSTPTPTETTRLGGGTDINQSHCGMLDADGNFANSANGLHHATYREYSSDQGRWMGPAPYSGSYDYGIRRASIAMDISMVTNERDGSEWTRPTYTRGYICATTTILYDECLT